ncbi:MAG: alpha/beta hydrolase [Anaerolineales bacterium]|nr:alpha/beta hydrolase [Anaerolineales bacterium]
MSPQFPPKFPDPASDPSRVEFDALDLSHRFPPPASHGPVAEAKTDHIERKMFDLAYASLSPAQKLDLYWPEQGNGPFPVVVSIHGGAFMGGDKRDIQLTPMLEVLKHGYALAGVNYRMSGEAKFPALIHDIKTAIRWLRANAARYLLDPQRIAVWGGSAGGYLALMAGVAAGIQDLDDPSLGNAEQSEQVQAVVAWFPPTDFLKMDQQLADSGFRLPPQLAHDGEDSPESLLLGQKITQIPDLVQRANPETYLRPGLPPFFIQHGRMDDTVPYQQSLNFAQKLAAIPPQNVIHEVLPDARHADPAFETPQNVQKVLDFLGHTLRG